MKKYYLSFYENGKFSHHIGGPKDSKADALAGITTYYISLSSIFNIKQDGSECFHYDRYGTHCTVKIEEE